MTDSKKILLADIALLVAAMGWGGGFIAGDIAVEYFPPFTIMAWRFLVGALVVFLLFFKLIMKSGRKEITYGVVLGLMLFCIQPLQLISLEYIAPSKQGFLLSSYAALTPFVSWIVLKKNPGIKSMVAGGMVVIGIGIVSLQESLMIGFGDMLALGFAVGYSIMVVYTGIFAVKSNPLAMTFFSFLTTGILGLIVALIFEEPVTSYPAEGVYALAYLALINTVMSYSLQNVAQRYTSATHTAVLLSTESLIAFSLGVFVYGDPFTIRLLLGGLTIFAAVLVSSLEYKPKFFILNKK